MADYKIGVDLVLKDMASGNLKSFRDSLQNIKPDFKAIGVAAGIATGAMALLGKSALDVSGQFNTALAEVSTIVDTTQIDIGAMGDQIIAMSQKVPQSAALLTRGLYEVISADVEASKAMGVLEVAARAATAGLTTTEVAVDGITTVLNAYGMAAEEAERISDIAFETVKRGKLRFEEFASTIGTVATPAAVAGVSIEEVAAAVATMTKKGLDAATATTYLRGVLMSVLNPSGEAKKIAKELGLDFSAAGLKAKGLAAFLQDVSGAAKGNSDILTALFGDVRAFTGVLTISGEGAKSFENDLVGMYGAVGKTQEAFDKMMKTHGATMQLLKNNWENFLIVLGNSFLPTISKLTVLVSASIKGLSDLATNNKELIAGFGLTAIAITGVTAGLAGVGFILPSLIGGFKAMGLLCSTILPNAIGAITIVLRAFILSPIGILTAGVGLLAVEFLKLKKNTDDLVDTHNQHVDSISGLITGYNKLSDEAIGGNTLAIGNQKKILETLRAEMSGYGIQLGTISSVGQITAKDIAGINSQLVAQYNAQIANMTMLERTGRESGSFLKRVGVSLLGIGQLIATGTIAVFQMLWTTISSYVVAIANLLMKLSANISDLFVGIFTGRGDLGAVKKAGEELGSSFGGGIKEGLIVSTGNKITQDWKGIMSDFASDAKKISGDTMDSVYGEFLSKGMPKLPKLLSVDDLLPKKTEVASKTEEAADGVKEGIETATPGAVAAAKEMAATVSQAMKEPGKLLPELPKGTPAIAEAEIPLFGAISPMEAAMQAQAPLPVPPPEFLQVAIDQEKSIISSFFDFVTQGAVSTEQAFKSSIDMMASAFSTGIQGMLSGAMSFKEGMKTIWQNMTTAIIKMIAEIIAKMIALQVVKGAFAVFGIPLPSFQTRPGEFKVVPGAPNAPSIIQAHGGEVVGRPVPAMMQPAGAGASSNITVNISPSMMFGGDAGQMANAIKGLFREHDLMANKGLTSNYMRKI